MGAGRAAEWLVVAGGVDDELADELAGGGVDDSDLQVLDEHDDRGAGVFVAGAARSDRSATKTGGRRSTESLARRPDNVRHSANTHLEYRRRNRGRGTGPSPSSRC